MGSVSGPVTRDDAPVAPDRPSGDRHPDLEVVESRSTSLGGVPVRRALPKRAHRTVGAWCFLDHFGPTDSDAPMQVGPHPHMGLQTVTWLVSGEVLHRDSLGTEQRITPGQLNLMSAGRGISHAEETIEVPATTQLGAQLWVAQPEATRHGDADFEHHGELPTWEQEGWTATVLVGALGRALSPARTDSPLVGCALAAQDTARSRIDLDPLFEHALVVLRGAAEVGGTNVEPGVLVYVAPGHDRLEVATATGADLVLVGGEPFPEPITMSWNFVGRDRDEMAEAHEAWARGDERFGRVVSDLPRIDAPSSP
jgi:quercetin 2,3-dioxygenase